MNWLLLFVAGLFEIGMAIGFKYTQGFTRLTPSLVTIGCAAFSMWLLALAVRTLPIGTAYPIWTGIGTVGAVAAGILVLGESAAPLRLLFAALIVTGIAGLKWIE